MNTGCFLYLYLVLAIRCLCIRADRTELPFAECNTQNCGIVDCIRVPISLSLNAGYSSENVLCIDNSLPASYLLTSCPNGFSSTVQNTSGVCSITTSDNKTDLLLRAKELISGLHQFDCSTSDSTKPVIFSSTSVIIANDDTPYRDVLAYVNRVFQHDHHNSTSVVINRGDNLTLVVRGVGGVGNILRMDAVDSRFTCTTGFACNMQLSPSLLNRYLECSLKTPAELSDNERALTFILDSTEQIQITISVNEIVNDSAIVPTATSVTTLSNTSSVATSSNTSASPPLYEDSEDMPYGVIIGVTAAVVSLAVVLILVAIGIACVLKKNKLARDKKLNKDTSKSMEKGSAPPISRRSSITSVDGQQPITSLTSHEQPKEFQLRVEEVNADFTIDE